MKNKKKHIFLVEKIPNEIILTCDYGCEQRAYYYLGKSRRPCCSKCASKCKAVVEKSIRNGKLTKFKKYGNENYNNSTKAKQTNLSRYGNTCSLHGKEIKNKLKEKWIKKYGVDCPAKSKYHQDKIRASIKAKYGVDNVYKIPEVIHKIQEKNKINQKEITNKTKETRNNWTEEKRNNIKLKQRNINRKNRYKQLFNNSHIIPMFSIEEYINSINLYTTSFKWKCKHCHQEFTSLYAPFSPIKGDGNIYGRCLNCFPHAKSDGISIEEIEVLTYIKSIYSGPIIQSSRILKNNKGNYQIDIYLPELNFGIEYNGIYFHQLKFCSIPHYHLEKTLIAEKQNIHLMHIISTEWNYQKDLIKTLIKQIIYKNVNIETYFDKNTNKLIIDRSKFNLAYNIEGYKLIEIIDPKILKIKVNNILYDYENCGYLIYEKIKQ